MQNLTLHNISSISISPTTTYFPYSWREFLFTNEDGNETRVVAHAVGIAARDKLLIDKPLSTETSQLIANLLSLHLTRLTNRTASVEKVAAVEKAISEFNLFMSKWRR